VSLLRNAIVGKAVIDLHTHSTASDGSDAPERVVELAAAAQCSAMALTDHDTLVGLSAAGRRADELGITLIRGCEVSCAFKGTSAHVLVYFVEGTEGPLQDELIRLREDRVARNRLLVDKLRDLGVGISYEEVRLEAGGDENMGRPHFAAVLVRHGAAESVQDAFDRWLGRDAPGYVPKARVSPATVADLATQSGAVSVLAHPLTLGLSPQDLRAAVGELADSGFGGIEAIYGRYTDEERQGLQHLAREFDLVATGGSDYHGDSKPDLTVGTGRGDLKVPDDVLERLAARRPR
jgi:predicted metal-dependent phosphoesterase TrpH